MPAGNYYSPGFLDSRDLQGMLMPMLQAEMEQLWAPRISIEVPSDRETETYGWLGQVPALRQWIGGRSEEQLNKFTMSIKNLPYEATVPVSLRDLANDKTGQLNARLGELARRAATHWNTLIGTLITNGGGSTSGLAYDGQFFFDTDHNESGTNQTNALTATEVPAADVATSSTMTTTEAANVVTQTIAYMMSLTDDKGEPINQAPTEVIVICTKVGHYNGLKTAVGLNNLGTGSGNNNPLLAWAGYSVTPIFVPQRVTAADKLYFFFGNPSMSSSPFIRQVERDVQIKVDTADEFKFDRHVYGIDTIRGAGYGMWSASAQVTLS